MTVYAIIFYVVAGFILVATGLAITRRHPVHAVVYLILSFLGSALLFYLLGAPFLAALEIIIYAGAIMVLFLFVIMLLRGGGGRGNRDDAGPVGAQPSYWVWSFSRWPCFWSLRTRAAGSLWKWPWPRPRPSAVSSLRSTGFPWRLFL